MPTHFEREIFEQPACLRRLLDEAALAVEEIAEAARRFRPRFVVTAARGSSDNAARYAKYLFGAHNRLVVSLGAPSLVTLYDAAPAFGDALVIGISQSGESPDIVALVAEGRRQGALTVAVTNQSQSPLARAAAHMLPLHIGPEQAVVASKSYSSELLALAMLSAAIEENPERARELEQLPDVVARTLELCGRESIATSIAPFVDADRMVVLGRGFNFATAFEVALKIKETTYALAEAYATPDIFHGPFAMIESGFPVIVIAPTGATLSDMLPAIDALEGRQAEIVVISNDPNLLARSSIRVRLPLASGVPEWLSPITAIVPGQLWALALAEARGVDPDHPRGLAKITLTR